MFNTRVPNLYLVGLEVTRGDRLKDSDGNLNGLSGIPVTSVFLKLFLELTHGLLLFSSSWNSGEPNDLSWRVDSVACWTFLLIAANKGDIDTEWSDSSVLRIFVEVLANSLSNHVDRRAVRELHFEFSGLLSQQSYDVSSVIHVANDDSSTVITNWEDIGYWIWHNKFVWNFLGAANDNAIFSLNSDRSLTKLLDSFEGVFHLEDSTLWVENLHGVIKACHFSKWMYL